MGDTIIRVLEYNAVVRINICTLGQYFMHLNTILLVKNNGEL